MYDRTLKVSNSTQASLGGRVPPSRIHSKRPALVGSFSRTLGFAAQSDLFAAKGSHVAQPDGGLSYSSACGGVEENTRLIAVLRDLVSS